jgi:hypothetical protein
VHLQFGKRVSLIMRCVTRILCCKRTVSGICSLRLQRFAFSCFCELNEKHLATSPINGAI